jgi:hypothetical protein
MYSSLALPQNKKGLFAALLPWKHYTVLAHSDILRNNVNGMHFPEGKHAAHERKRELTRPANNTYVLVNIK